MAEQASEPTPPPVLPDGPDFRNLAPLRLILVVMLESSPDAMVRADDVLRVIEGSQRGPTWEAYADAAQALEAAHARERELAGVGEEMLRETQDRLMWGTRDRLTDAILAVRAWEAGGSGGG